MVGVEAALAAQKEEELREELRRTKEAQCGRGSM